MADPHEPTSPTSFDAQTGDAMAFGLYGDPAARQWQDGSTVPTKRPSFGALDNRHLAPKTKLILVAWAVAVFAISAAISPYILN